MESNKSEENRKDVVSRKEEKVPLPGPFKKIKVKRKRLPLLGGIIAALFVGILALVIALSVTAPQRRAKSFVNNIVKLIDQDMKVSTFIGYFPDKLITQSADSAGMSKKDFKQSLQEQLDEEHELWSSSPNAGSFRINSVGLGSITSHGGGALRELKEYYVDEYQLNVTGAKTVVIEVKASLNGEEKVYELPIRMVRVSGKWCVDPRIFELFLDSDSFVEDLLTLQYMD